LERFVAFAGLYSENADLCSRNGGNPNVFLYRIAARVSAIILAKG
jgi:hypothetical protein